MSKMKLFLILPLFSFIFSQECILGKNCPYNQGICVGNSCQCLDGFRSFFDPKLPQTEQTYCNYQQKNHFIALVLELVLPGFGHFYTGKYWFGIGKLILCLSAVGTSIYLFKEMKIPSYIEAIGKTIMNKITEKKEEEGLQGTGGFTTQDAAQLLFNITFHPFWILWIVDIYMYFSKSYYDGNNIPLY